MIVDLFVTKVIQNNKANKQVSNALDSYIQNSANLKAEYETNRDLLVNDTAATDETILTANMVLVVVFVFAVVLIIANKLWK